MEFELQVCLNDKCGSWYIKLLNWIASGLKFHRKDDICSIQITFEFFFREIWFEVIIFLYVLGSKNVSLVAFLCWSSFMFGTSRCYSGWSVLGGHLRTQIVRLASLSRSSLLPAPFSFSILDHLSPYIPNQLCLLPFV